MFSATEKNRILSHVKDTIFLQVKILFQRSNEKSRRVFIRSVRSNVLLFVSGWRFVDISLFGRRSFSANKMSFSERRTKQNFPDG